MSKVTVRCTHCSAQLSLKDRSRLGKQVSCPKCGKPFVLQEVDEWDGLDDFGPAPSSQAPVVRGGAKKPSKKRRKSSSGMSGGLLAAIIGGVAVLLLVVVGVGLWASGMFAPPAAATGEALAQTDQASTPEAPVDAQPVEPQPVSDPSAEVSATVEPDPQPVSKPAIVTTADAVPEVTTPVDAVTTAEALEPEPIGDGLSDEQARTLTQAAIRKFLEDVTSNDTQSARTAYNAFMLDASTAQQVFGDVGDDVGPVLDRLNKEALAGFANGRREMRILLLANVQFDVFDYRTREDNDSQTKALLAAAPRNVRFLGSRIKFQGDTNEFMDCVILNGAVRGLPPLDEILRELDDGAIPIPQLARRPPAPLDSVGEAFVGGSAGDTRNDNGLQATFVWCPPGMFGMGTTADHKPAWAKTTPPPPTPNRTGVYLVEPWVDLSVENPVDVELTTGFWIGQTEVTRGQWQNIMNTRPWASGVRSNDGDDYPAIFVTWENATEFCEKLTTTERQAGRLPPGWEYALPTEAQWEYACRTGTETHFSFGDDPAQMPEFGWYISVTGPADEFFAHRVAQKQPSPWGLFDMHGNVEEMCRDWYSERLPGGVDPLGPAFGDTHTTRGGHFAVSSEYCRSASRSWAFDTIEAGGAEMQGFRVAIVRSMAPEE